MAVVPGGVFHAGAVMLEVGPFAIDRAEVTAGAYQACAQAGVCDAPVDPMGQMLRPELPGGERHPRDGHDLLRLDGRTAPHQRGVAARREGYEPRRYPWGDRVAEAPRAHRR